GNACFRFRVWQREKRLADSSERAELPRSFSGPHDCVIRTSKRYPTFARLLSSLQYQPRPRSFVLDSPADVRRVWFAGICVYDRAVIGTHGNHRGLRELLQHSARLWPRAALSERRVETAHRCSVFASTSLGGKRVQTNEFISAMDGPSCRRHRLRCMDECCSAPARYSTRYTYCAHLQLHWTDCDAQP